MILQYVTFGGVNACNESDLYFFSREKIETKENLPMCINRGNILDFNTYFNFFSVGKWKKYTDISNLKLILFLQGNVRIKLIHSKYEDGKIKKTILHQKQYISDNVSLIDINIPYDEVEDGMISFSITGLSDKSFFHRGYYFSDMDRENINIGVNICTFNREKDVNRLINVMEELTTNTLYNQIHENIYTFIIDNGNTLNLESKEKILVYRNKNTGGAGGFTRGLIEILAQKNIYNLTHVLFLDDDIVLNPESIFRMCSFLSVLKKEHRKSIISGAMLLLDRKYLQYSSGEKWENCRTYSPKNLLDLRKIENVLKNEIEADINYSAWGFCSIPLSIVDKNNLPLPLFIHHDDVEYGLRLQQNIITLNGVCMWHEDFSKRKNSELEYYRIRNSMIVNSIYMDNYSCVSAKICLLKQVIRNLLLYRYQDINISLKAMIDFCEGIDDLKAKDPIELHNQIRNIGYKFEVLKENNIPIQEKMVSKLKAIVTFNGYFLKGNDKKIYIGNDYRSYYRVKTAVVYTDENYGIILKRNIKEIIINYRKLKKVYKIMDMKFENAKNSYKNRWKELVLLEFWKEYLEIEG